MLEGPGPCDICEFGRDKELVKTPSGCEYTKYPHCWFSPSLAYIHGSCNHFEPREDVRKAVRNSRYHLDDTEENNG
jgi:hypothetical protein